MATKVTVDTTQYEFAQGRKPRGAGYWAFALGDGTGRWRKELFWVSAPYGEAKRQAVREARRQGCSDVVVQS